MLTESERELIAKVKAAHEAATPGKWARSLAHWGRAGVIKLLIAGDPEFGENVSSLHGSYKDIVENPPGLLFADADHIAISHNSIPSLLDIIERLEKRLKLVTASHRNKD